MFSLETLIMVSVILFCVGGLVGAVISRTLMPPQGQKDMEERLKTSRQELAEYQQDVAQHFMETSKLVNKMTQSYRDVHEHLADGAMQLTNAEISRKMLEAGEAYSDPADNPALAEVAFEPPRDWAPKTPGQAGMLSEEFGLADSHDAPDIESVTATHRSRSHQPDNG